MGGQLEALRPRQGSDPSGGNLRLTEAQPHHTKSDPRPRGYPPRDGRPRSHATQGPRRQAARRRGQAQGGRRASGRAIGAPTASDESEPLGSRLPAAPVSVKVSRYQAKHPVPVVGFPFVITVPLAVDLASTPTITWAPWNSLSGSSVEEAEIRVFLGPEGLQRFRQRALLVQSGPRSGYPRRRRHRNVSHPAPTPLALHDARTLQSEQRPPRRLPRDPARATKSPRRTSPRLEARRRACSCTGVKPVPNARTAAGSRSRQSGTCSAPRRLPPGPRQ